MISIQEMKDIKKDLTSDYSKVYKNYDTMTQMYNQDLPLGKLKSGTTRYTPPTARAQLDTAVDHIMGLRQKVTMPLWSKDQTDKETASDLEFIGQAILDWMERAYRFNIRRMCVKNGFLYGQLVLKGPLYVPRVAANLGIDVNSKDWIEYLRKTFPFVFKSGHPKTVLVDTHDPPQCVIESYMRSATSIKEQYPQWESKGRKDEKWWEFWSPTQRQYFVDDVPLLGEGVDEITGKDLQANISGFIPYETGYAGFGVDEPDGKMEYLIVGLLQPGVSSYKAEARMKTAVQYGLEQGIFQIPVTDIPVGPDFVEPAAPGDIAVHPKKYNYHLQEVPKITQDTYAWLSMIDKDQQSISPRIMQGQWTKGMTSGYLEAITIGQARIKYEGVISSWERMAAGILDHILVLVKDVIDEPIGIMGKTIDPKKIDTKKQHYVVTLAKRTEEEKERKQMLGAQLWAMGFLPHEQTIRTYTDFDWLTIRQQQLVEEGLNNPMIKQAIAQAAMEDAGMHELLDMINEGKFEKPKPGASPEGAGAPLHGFGTESRSQMLLDQGQGELNSQIEQEGVQ